MDVSKKEKWKSIYIKIKANIYDMHLYKDRLESLIKTMIWIISWLGGISIVTDFENGAGSAYLLFSLALLMEFVQKIKEKKEKVAVVLHAFFCFTNAIILIMSCGLLFSKEMSIDIMYLLSKIVIAYMIIDSFLLWVFPAEDTDDKKTDIATSDDEIILKFKKSLTEGLLGNIK